MKVKFHGQISESRKQPGSGAQGASLGNHEFISQTNNNADSVPEEDRYKFVDDLSCLEIINLLSIGLASHNFRQQVPSDIPSHGQIINSEHLKTQKYLDEISRWTTTQKMFLNGKKTKAMIVNFTQNYQFTTRLRLKSTNLDIVDSMKILGTILNNKLDWNENCKNLINKVNKIMLFLRKIRSFGASQSDMVHLWVVYCRSVLEQSAVLWQGGLTQENRESLERTQKSFVKLILKGNNSNYETLLDQLNLTTLDKRRDILSLRWAKKCLSNEKTTKMFPINKKYYNTRHKEKYTVFNANTERMKNSPFIYMQHLLNKDHEEEGTPFARQKN